MKNEDGVRSRTCEGSDSGANYSKSLDEEEKKVSGVSEQGSANEEGRMKKEETLPPCLEIMKRVMERSRGSDDHSLSFTIDEMEFLAADPLFARLDPRLASDIRKILEKGPPD